MTNVFAINNSTNKSVKQLNAAMGRNGHAAPPLSNPNMLYTTAANFNSWKKLHQPVKELDLQLEITLFASLEIAVQHSL